MREKLEHLPKPVVKTILGFYRRKRFYEFLRALIAPLLCYGVLALIGTHLDRFLFLETSDRLWISGLTHGISILAGVLSMAVFAWRRLPVGSLAYELERMLPKATAERLVTLNDILGRAAEGQVVASGVHDRLVDQLTGETVAICEGTPHAGGLARDRRLKMRIRGLVVLALVWAALFSLPSYQFPLMLQRLTWPNRNLPKPSFMHLTVTPEAPVVGRGGEVVLQVQAEGSIPRFLRAPMRWLGSDAAVSLLATEPGKVERLPVTGEARPMSRVQSRLFVASLIDLQESFSYRVRCGDAETDIRFAHVVAQPRATNVVVEVVPPEYTRLETASFRDLNDPVPAFAGSAVRVRFAVDQSPLKSARLINLVDGNALPEPKYDSETGTYLYEFEMVAQIEMEIVLVNELDFENVERVRIYFELREDQAPGVRMEYPAGELTSAQGDLVPIYAEITDDLGLLEAAVCYQINAGRNATTREIPLPLKDGELSQSISTTLDLAKVGAVPGDEVLLWLRGRDSGRSDTSSQTVRIRVTALGGNENERRRLAALRLLAQALMTVEPSAKDSNALVMNEEKYEPIAVAAGAQDLELSSRAAPESLLDFMEREHHFTDSAAAAAEVRLLHEVIYSLFHRPSAHSPQSVESRRAALRQIGEETLPSLLRERTARDLVRRALSLRSETLATVEVPDAADRNTRATRDRRAELLQEAIENTGADIGALARMSPQVNIDELHSITRQISRISRDLKRTEADRRQAAGKAMCEQIDGWIRLLLPPVAEWKTQRLAARAALRAQRDGLRAPLEKARRTDPGKLSAEAIRLLVADARIVERSPYIGLAERLVSISAPIADASLNAATACESELLSRMAVESEFGDWIEGARVTPTELRLAAALKALDSAASDAARSAAGEQLRTLVVDDGVPAEVVAAAPPGSIGFYSHLPALTTAATTLPAPYEEELEALAVRASGLQDTLAQVGTSSVSGIGGALAKIEAGLAQWEGDVLSLSYRVHLDLTYGDPGREQTILLSAALPALRDTLSRYQVLVPMLIARVKSRLGQGSGDRNLTGIQLDMADLTRHVSALGGGLKRTVKLLRGETPPGLESGAVREIRLCYAAARKMAEAKDPAAVAEAFFSGQPAAGAIVLGQRTPMLRELQDNIRTAGEVLKTETAAAAAFQDPMRRAAKVAADFEQQLTRFARLDADGVVRALVAEARKRAEALVHPDAGAETLALDRLKMDELRRHVELLESQVRELIAGNAPITPGGWWGGPAGIRGGAGRRDAEHARRRARAQFERARREAVLGFDAVLDQRMNVGAALPDAPLAGSLFAWRTLHSSVGGATTVRRRIVVEPPLYDALVVWLEKQLRETEKALRQAGGARRFREATANWVESAGGKLKH